MLNQPTDGPVFPLWLFFGAVNTSIPLAVMVATTVDVVIA